ncbi:plasmid mobilization protein [Methylomagnum sp.]
MLTANQRIPVLVTAGEKARIAEMARSAGVSMGEYLRRAAVAYRPSEDEALLEGMITQMLKTTRQAEQAIDDALAYVEASNRRLAALESNREAG